MTDDNHRPRESLELEEGTSQDQVKKKDYPLKNGERTQNRGDVDGQEDQETTDDDTVLNRLIENFVNTTTAHGIPNIYRSKSTVQRAFWTLAVLICLSAFILEGTRLIRTFLSYPYSTRNDIVSMSELEFPAVSICNVNMMRRSMLANTRFAHIVLLDNDGISDTHAETQETDDETTGDYAWWFDDNFYDELEANSDHHDDEERAANGNTRNNTVTPQMSVKASNNRTDNETGSNGTRHDLVDPDDDGIISETDDDSDNETGDGAIEDGLVDSDDEELKNDRGQTRGEEVGGGVTVNDDEDDENIDEADTHDSEHGHEEQTIEDLSNMSPEELAADDHDFAFYDYNWRNIHGDTDWTHLLQQARFPDNSDVRDLLQPTLDELRLFGHQPEDFILQCNFDRRPCSYRNFTVFQHGDYGNCFTFNGRSVHDQSQQTAMTGRTGAQYGLHLTLFVEQPEYVGLFSTESGVKVSIHPPTEQPFPEDEGLTASTGEMTTISLRQILIDRLGEKYNVPCTYTGEDTNFSSDRFSYTIASCMKMCLQEFLFKVCGCVTNIRLKNGTHCSTLDPAQARCRQLVEHLYHSSSMKCRCPIPCRELSYSRSISSSLWPSKRFEGHLKEQLVKVNNKTEKILMNSERTRQNVVNLIVYFEQLNYEHNQQFPSYTLESLFGDLGGIAGLFIGVSFMSIGEVFIFILEVGGVLSERLRRESRRAVEMRFHQQQQQPQQQQPQQTQQEDEKDRDA
ncbi:uncharacterized protein [Diadema setosum]|uniref:uncharacterized protein n=1 Tax=Diadema setosum TaxID=31175 RepID=UPI003B3A72BB